MHPRSGRYLAYNNSIAAESATKFPEEIECSTVHSMAYKATVRPLGLKIAKMKVKDMTEFVDTSDLEIRENTAKSIAIQLMEKFFVSEHLSFELFSDTIEGDIPEICFDLAKKYIDKMKNKQIPCSHGFYLKLYHIFLANKHLEPEKVDLLMLDEAGDINPVILAIFKLLRADKKIMVGDRQQNIYSFNNTINGFEALKDEGVELYLTRSFRVSKPLAQKIESFANVYLDKDMTFKGVEYPEDEEIKSRAYIGRTNGALIDKMIELNDRKIEYNLVRKASDMFALPLALMNLKPGCEVFQEDLKWLEEDAREFFGSPALRREFNNIFTYLQHEHSHDSNLKSAIQLILKHTSKKIYDTYKIAKSHEVGTKCHFVTLTTAHSSKGLEFDEVWLLEDMNEKLDDIIGDASEQPHGAFGSGLAYSEFLSNFEAEELRLYYVACSRSRLKLVNAKHLL